MASRPTAGAAPAAGRDADSPLITINRLEKVYQTTKGGTVHALASIDMAIGRGEFLSVVGPSGCGKTTLLKILGGLLSKTTGAIELDGSPLLGPRRDIGIVFQSPVLLPWRTVLENVLVIVEALGYRKARYVERARQLLTLAGLTGFEDKYPYELSGGMQQRTSIVRALVHDPAILLMDEPFGALDALTREQMNLELLRIWEESRKTVFFITHSIPEAVFLSDRVVVMSPRPGRIIRELSIDLPRPRDLEMMSSPEFVGRVTDIRHLLMTHGRLD